MNNIEHFETLTKYIGKFDTADSLGEWIIDTKNDGTLENPRHMSWVNYTDLVIAFKREFYQFSKDNPEYELSQYSTILQANGLKWSKNEIRSIEADKLDAKCILALIMGAVRADRFSEGALLGFLKDGNISNWLKRLKDIDKKAPSNCQ
ncbi:MAG: DUF6508 domain-containing protein [Defluviitaleaceae bacterium]|nr:DUF6508 domain-containing protein [Defluviitaleaceae bacterium]